VKDGDRPEPTCALDQSYQFYFSGGQGTGGSYALVTPEGELTVRDVSAAGESVCTTKLPACGSPGVDLNDLKGLFADPAVLASFTGLHVSLGHDTRPVDGEIFVIEREDSQHIQVGDPCGEYARCTPIPSQVSKLQELLTELKDQQAKLPCE
jgi:hypothetical protein